MNTRKPLPKATLVLQIEDHNTTAAAILKNLRANPGASTSKGWLLLSRELRTAGDKARKVAKIAASLERLEADIIATDFEPIDTTTNGPRN